jgi:hypothetical protein
LSLIAVSVLSWSLFNRAVLLTSFIFVNASSTLSDGFFASKYAATTNTDRPRPNAQ